MSKITEHEFEQLLGEAVHRLEKEIVYAIVNGVARERGWPIPEEFRHEAIVPLALLVKAVKELN